MAKAPRGWDKVMSRDRKRPVRTGRRSAPAGKKRLLIAKQTESRVRDIIENWEEPRISWKAVIAAVNEEFKGRWTRAAVAKHAKLQKAFSDTQRKLRALKKGGTGRTGKEGDGTIEVLQRQMRTLREEIQELRTTNAKLQEKFVRWKTNAYLNGWSIKNLDKAIDKIDRGQSDEDG